jgi:hypothetical protein
MHYVFGKLRGFATTLPDDVRRRTETAFAALLNVIAVEQVTPFPSDNRSRQKGDSLTVRFR